jgi:hypothetical protein
VAGRVGLKVVRGDDRPWTDRWLKILRSLESLRQAYALDASATGIEGVSDRADNFFVHCFHLRDWLENTGTASSADVRAQTKSTPLRWCDAMCNSEKHHTRDWGVTARIREACISPGTAGHRCRAFSVSPSRLDQGVAALHGLALKAAVERAPSPDVRVDAAGFKGGRDRSR